MRYAQRSQAGQSLVESLLAVFLVGTVVLAGMALLMTIILSSANHRGQAVASNEATTVIEAVQGLAYIPCTGTVDYNSAKSGLRPGYTATISVSYLQVETAGNPSTFGACPAAGDQGAQKIVVNVKMNVPPKSSVTIETVKRNKTCPTGGGELC